MSEVLPIFGMPFTTELRSEGRGYEGVFRVARRFLAVRRQFTGDGAEQYLGVDEQTQTDVVLQVFSREAYPPGMLMRLEHEAECLRRGIARKVGAILHVENQERELILVRSHVSGESLRDRLNTGPLSVSESIQVALSLLQTLAEWHQLRVLHRNVRPTTIILQSSGRTLQACLVDLAPPPVVSSRAISQQQLLELAQYLSPELAGTLDADIAEQADLYSVGAVLFHMLTGQPPFHGETSGDVFLSRVTGGVPSPRANHDSVPRALDDFTQRLLQEHPRDRYQSTTSALADLTAIFEQLNAGIAEPTVIIGANDRRVSLTESVFVARQEELSRVYDHIEQLQAGRGGYVALEAESGGGKSRFIAELARRAVGHGLRVFRGLGSSEVAQRPFQLLDGVIEQLLKECRENPDYAASILARVDPELHHAIVTALPTLMSIFPSHSTLAKESTATLSETRTVYALTELLAALGGIDRPALIVLDDCQWADELTYKLLRRWQRMSSERSQQGCFVMLLAAYRSEEVGSEHPLRRMTVDETVVLQPLSAAEIRQLLESMAGPLSDAVIAPVVRLADGSPFMASAILRGLVEAEELIPGPNGWVLTSESLEHLQSSHGAAELLSQRLERLPAETLALLTAGAILGKEFELDLAAHLINVQRSQAVQAVDVARQRKLIWMRSDGGQYAFVHDKIRAAVLHRLTSEARQELHRSAAEYLRWHASHRVSELAYHFDAANESQAALPFALEAAEQARRRHALEVAEQQYRIAKRGARERSAGLRYRIAEGLGETLMLLGRYADAGEEFEAAMSLAETDLARAQIRTKVGELRFKRGDKEQALDDFEVALRILGRRVPQHRVTLWICLIWELVVQMAHTCLPRWLLHRIRRTPDDSEKLAIRLYSHYAHGCWYCRDQFICLWSHLRGLNAAECFQPSAELANAYAEHAPAMTLVAYFSRAIRYVKKSHAIRTQMGDIWGQGHSLHYHGVVLYAAARYEECIVKCREAVRLLERTGDYWQVHIARYQIAASLYRLGDFEGALKTAQVNHRSGLDLGDEQASAISLDLWARTVPTGVPEEILDCELSRQHRDAQGTTQLLFAHGVSLLQRGEIKDATDTLEMAIAVAEQTGICNPYTSPVLPWAATAWRLQMEQSRDLTPTFRRFCRHRAWLNLDKAWRAAWLCRNDMPRIEREAAILLAADGKVKRSRRRLRRSIKIARQFGAQHELTQSLRLYAQLGRECRWSDAEAAHEEAEQLWLKLEPMSPLAGADRGQTPTASLSLLDRFDTILTSGRAIASALLPQNIFDLVASSALRLLRAEHSVMLCPSSSPESGHGWVPQDNSNGLKIDAELLRTALETGRVSVHAHATGFRRSRTGITGEQQPARLCVPLAIRQSIVAVLYVQNSQVGHEFGPEEVRLAEFLASLASAALENAEGFEQLQQLNATLEARIEDRTAAAESRATQLARSNRALEKVAQELRLAQAEVNAAKIAAETASAAKSQFLATMSHEIRTPMNGVIGMAELALATPLSNQQRNYLTVVKESAHALLSLLNDILDFSKIEAGHMELESIPFSLVDTMYDGCRLLSVQAAKKKIDLVCRIPAGVDREFVGDPGRLRQILINLIGNALKFTERGSVTLLVEQEEDVQGRAQLHFQVRDTGIGISKENQQLIFEAFRQSDSSITRRFGGTGLGLSISAQLCKLMNGRIWVESEPGQGSTFHVVLQLEHGRPSVRDVEAAFWETPPRVLVVATHPDARLGLSEQLSAVGCEVTVAATAQEALMAVMWNVSPDQRPQAVVIESAHESDGLVGLAQQLSGPTFGLNLPTVLIQMSAASSLPDLTASSRLMQLTKPAKPLEIVAALSSVLKGQALTVSVATDPEQRPQLAPLRILLADDSLVNLEVASGLLELEGHWVSTADDGQEAVDAWEQGEFDLVFLDVEMPLLDGLSATKRIRALEAEQVGRVRTPIYAMTAHAIHGYRETCLNAGMDGFITKPIQPAELRSVLQHVAQQLAATAESH